MNILIIAGHGAGDPGACRGSLKEADLTRDLAAKLHARLPDCTTVYDPARNAFKDVTKGVLKAEHFKAFDLVLELHFNAVKADSGDGKTKGVEAYVAKSEQDTMPARALCTALKGLGLTNRGVKRKNFSVIYTAYKAGVPAVLLEVCFLDDADDMAVYDPDKAAERIAVGLRLLYDLAPDPAWQWALDKGLLTDSDRSRTITGAKLAEVLYQLHGGEH